uniref:Uncharacterized protein n=1 Tax=Ditylenchus dipsaci TaxID=166011 RepID=A0A915E7F1_9BILA
MERIFAYKLLHGRVDSCDKVKQVIKLDNCVTHSTKKNTEHLIDPIRLEDYNCPPPPDATQINSPSDYLTPPILLQHPAPEAILKAPACRGPRTPTGSPGPTLISTARNSTPKQLFVQPEERPALLSQSLEEQPDEDEEAQDAEVLTHSTQIEIIEQEQDDDDQFCEAIEPDPIHAPVCTAAIPQQRQLQPVEVANQQVSVQPIDTSPKVATQSIANPSQTAAVTITEPPRNPETSQAACSQPATNGKQQSQEEIALLSQLKDFMEKRCRVYSAIWTHPAKGHFEECFARLFCSSFSRRETKEVSEEARNEEEQEKQGSDVEWEIIGEEGEIMSDEDLEEVSVLESLALTAKEAAPLSPITAVLGTQPVTTNETNLIQSDPLPVGSSVSASLHSTLHTGISATQTAIQAISNQQSPEKSTISTSIATAVPLDSSVLGIQRNGQYSTSTFRTLQSLLHVYSYVLASSSFWFPTPHFMQPPPQNNSSFFFPSHPPPMLYRSPAEPPPPASSQSKPNPAIEKVLASFSSIKHQPVLVMNNEAQKGGKENGGQKENANMTPQGSQQKSHMGDVPQKEQQMNTGGNFALPRISSVIATNPAIPSPKLTNSSTNSSSAAMVENSTLPNTRSGQTSRLQTPFQRCILSSFFSPLSNA